MTGRMSSARRGWPSTIAAVLREIGHFLYHLPPTLALMSRTTQADLYHRLMERAETRGLADQRAALVQDLEGHVLELGCGTGMMFPHYRAGVRVTAVEPDESFLQIAGLVAEETDAEIELRVTAGESLPFDDATFDAVVVAMVLCSVDNVVSVVRELYRVLKPDGQLRLIEHTRSERRLPGAMMSAANPVWRRLNGQGCNMHRDPLPALRSAGFDVTTVDAFQIFSPGLPAFPFKSIHATR